MCRIKSSIILISQAGTTLVTASTCYKYSGQIGKTDTDEAGSDVPCDPNAQFSACCGAGSICISNLYCYDAAITTPNVPGTCTDQSFTDPACPCPPSEESCRLDYPRSSLTFFYFRHPATSLNYQDDVTSCPDGSYCCGNNNTACCSSNSGNLEIFYGNPGPIPSATALLQGYYSSLHVSTKSRSTTISSSPSSIQSPTTVSASGSPTANTTATSSTRASSTPTSSTLTVSPTSSSHNNTGPGVLSEGAKIAIGIVIPVVALVAGFVAWSFLRRRRSYETASPRGETAQGYSAGVHVPYSAPAGELPSGLDRAELVTKQWDSAELPSMHEAVELAGRP